MSKRARKRRSRKGNAANHGRKPNALAAIRRRTGRRSESTDLRRRPVHV